MKIIIVLGNKLLPNGQISNILQERLDNSIKFYKRGDIFIVSGGIVQKTKYTEAYMMYKYIKKILPKSIILQEIKSRSTEENIYYCKKLLKNIKNKKIYIVTSEDHRYRVKKIVKRQNLNWYLYEY